MITEPCQSGGVNREGRTKNGNGYLFRQLVTPFPNHNCFMSLLRSFKIFSEGYYIHVAPLELGNGATTPLAPAERHVYSNGLKKKFLSSSGAAQITGKICDGKHPLFIARTGRGYSHWNI